MAGDKRKTEMVTDAFHGRPQPQQLHVSSTRCGTVPGTHTVYFDSAADTIELTHTARSRQGFANGAVHALERACGEGDYLGAVYFWVLIILVVAIVQLLQEAGLKIAKKIDKRRIAK